MLLAACGPRPDCVLDCGASVFDFYQLSTAPTLKTLIDRIEQAAPTYDRKRLRMALLQEAP